MSNHRIKLAAAALGLSLIGFNVSAATTYEASAADADPAFYGGSGGHALWFASDLPADFIFAALAGQFTMFDNGTATLIGEVSSASDPNRGFTVNMTFSGLTSTAPDGSPKKELDDSAYVENGGPVDTATWMYYTSWGGTLTGTGTFLGLDLTVERSGPAFQIGLGANGKNLLFGGSGWLTARDNEGHEYSGDFNLDLEAIPVPAALPLLLSGLLGLGIFGQRRN